MGRFGKMGKDCYIDMLARKNMFLVSKKNEKTGVRAIFWELSTCAGISQEQLKDMDYVATPHFLLAHFCKSVSILVLAKWFGYCFLKLVFFLRLHLGNETFFLSLFLESLNYIKQLRLKDDLRLWRGFSMEKLGTREYDILLVRRDHLEGLHVFVFLIHAFVFELWS